MGIVNRAAPDEPNEKPTALGRHLWNLALEHPGEWREAWETTNRSNAVGIEGCLIGRGKARIAPIFDLDGWEARLVERADDDGQIHYVVRVRFTPPVKAKPSAGMEKLRQGEHIQESLT